MIRTSRFQCPAFISRHCHNYLGLNGLMCHPMCELLPDRWHNKQQEEEGMSQKSLIDLYVELIFMNECGKKENILKFTDPDGVRSGKSGYSFGKSQFDTKNNPASLMCLRECGLTEQEIQGVVNQTIDVTPLNAKLASHADVIEKWDERQHNYCLNMALNFATAHGIPVSNPDGILAMADYDNQYGSMGAGACAFFQGLNHPVTAEDVLEFKLKHTKYGKEHPKDCKRRYDNLKELLAGIST